MWPKTWSITFVLICTIRRPFYWKHCLWKMRGYQINFWKKMKVLYGKFNDATEEVAISIYSAANCFLRYMYSVFMTMINQKYQSRFLVYDFSFTYIFKGYASILYGLGCSLPLWKSARNDSHCNCNVPP